MSKYVYPAIFEKEENGGYSVIFPDLEGCYTCGDDLADSMYMAEDVLAFTLYDYEKEGKELPVPSESSALKADNGFINLIACDTLEYQKMNNNKAIKKTLTIPEWLNEAAAKANLNFSQILQDALKERLNLT